MILMRKLDEQAIENIALGAALLGTGGGGDPYIGKLMALQAIKKYGPVTLLDIDEVPEDALIVPSAMMGAPSVLVEKISNGEEIKKSFKALEKYLGKKVYGTVPLEAGGVNSMVPLAVAAQMGIPIINCDGMGRAFPELQMVTYHLDGVPAAPMVLTDEKGNLVIFETITNKWAEDLARGATVTMGGSVMVNLYSMTGKQLKKSGIHGIITYSEEIGKAITNAQKTGSNAMKELLDKTKGYELFKGKICDVLRETKGGFNFGKAKLQGLEEYKGQSFELNFQNENLIALKDGKVMASTPDLICVVDLESSIPVTTEALKYGHRVVVIGLPCNPKWRTEKGLETVGPKYFGYDIDYVPIEKIMEGDNK
jgi:DUF917 family protein